MIVNDSVAVVTGGASGLGLATTKALLADGASVVIIDLPSSNGEAIAKELGDRVRFAAADVTDEAAVTAALDVAESLGPLRVAVNCAGIGNAVKTVSKKGAFPLDAFKKVVDVNLIGTFNVLRLAAERISKTDPSTANAASSSTPPRSQRTTVRSDRLRTPHRRVASSV